MLREVRGDLDWIVMKSLEKDRARRYETASGLAEDIRRHLASEPVLARGPSAVYRVGKFLRRYHSQVVGAAAFVVLLAGVAVLLSIWNRDRLQLAEAQGLRDRGILFQARELHAKADRDAALETIKAIFASPHVGPEAQLLQATLFVDNRRSKEAMAVLGNLLDEKPEIAGAAHSLMARILWESVSPDATVGATPCGCPIHRAATGGRPYDQIDDHRKQAETLLPETAEAYFLRAMTAITVKEQLAALDRALQLDSGHYESRRLRAYTYYASRKYDRLRDDALVMTILRPRDGLGYSLRAIAWRELGRYPEAMADYGMAIALTPRAEPQHVDLHVQRNEVFLRLGDYERVIAEAETCLALWPDKPVFQYHRFCGLTALGEYDTATTLFREIIAAGHEARQKFNEWCMNYVFDTLDAGRSWHLAGVEPAGAAFLPMIEAQETYLGLSAKGGRRLTTDGFSARWSPDGTKLAFSLGVQGRSGVAVYDPATKETDLLIVPGKDPRWSPDGRYLAFIRDRQNLRLEELLTPAPGSQRPPETDEELWLMNADGTAPRRLAQGSWPSWGSDSARLYYLSRKDGTLSEVSLADQAAEPKPIMKWSYVLPSVSPENRHVAHFEGGALKITELASQKVVAECKGPAMSWGVIGWSPTGNEVCLGGGNPQRDKTGLWLYDLNKKEFRRVLDGQITATCWSAGGTELTFCMGTPYLEVWSLPLDSGVPTSAALGPGQTLDEHLRAMLAFYNRRIEADPQDAYAYSSRAHYYDSIGDKNSARADMRQWSVVQCPELPRSSILAGLPTSPRAIDLPFDCELVFSAERPVNTTPMMSVALGQKGRCEMRLFQIPMFVMSLGGVGFFSGLAAPPAYAGFTFGEPVKFGRAINRDENIDCFSADGLEMYISSNRPGGFGDWDLWVLKRASTDGAWGPPENVGSSINSSKEDSVASISTDGLTIYFNSDRSGGYGGHDIYMATRPTKNSPWGQTVNLGPTINSAANDVWPWISPDGLELYLGAIRGGGYGSTDIYVARRATVNDTWGKPVNLGPAVNSPYGENWFSLSPDGLLLLFCDNPAATLRPGGYGSVNTWMSRRATLSDPWQAPVNLGPTINTPGGAGMARIAPDGSMLYFRAVHDGTADNWQASILPIVDFDGDGKVDAADMALLDLNWGRDHHWCDIGPFPWGDGIVDTHDLRVLQKTLTGSDPTAPLPQALDVPRDTILSWVSAPFAQSYDVYFGTFLTDVESADRAHPRGVLVSRSHTTTTFDPEGLLDYSRSYYWRVDLVSAGAAPVIYKGAVLDFTTEAFAYPIKSIRATASTAAVGCGPERTVDGSGLDKNDGHSIDQKDMWWSTGLAPNWIQYEFDRVYHLHELWVWNFNSALEPFMGFGARTVKIEYSIDGTTWTPLSGVPEFAQAPGQPGYAANTTVRFDGVAAKFVKLTIEKNWGVTPQTGLSEVRFFAIQSGAAAQP